MSNYLKFKFIVFYFIIFIFHKNFTYADENNLRKQFLEQMPQACKQLKNIYQEGLDLELTIKKDDIYVGKKRICIDYSHELNYSTIHTNEEYISVINPQYGFSIEKESTDSAWILENMIEGSTKIKEHHQFTHNLLPTSELAFGGLFLEYGWIDDLILSNTFTILSIMPKHNDQTKTLHIEVQFKSQHNIDKNNKVLGGLLLFDPSNFWVMVECNVDIEFSLSVNKQPGKNIFNKYKIHKYFEYQNIDKVPFPKKITTIYTHSNRPPIKNTIEYTSIKRSMPSKEIFYMSHYGFPEPSHPMQRGDVIRIILMVAGLIMILIGLYMKFLAKRMK
jgi:hypothetical protein